MKSQYSAGDLAGLAREHAQSRPLHEMVSSEARGKPVGVVVADSIELTQGGIGAALERIESALDRLALNKPAPSSTGGQTGAPLAVQPPLVVKLRECADRNAHLAEWAHRLALRIEEVV